MLRSCTRMSFAAVSALTVSQAWTVDRRQRSTTFTHCEPAPPVPPASTGTFIGLYLTEASKSRLQQFLDNSFSTETRKFKAPDSVVLHPSAPASSLEAFEAIFGTDGAFRLKGIIITDSTAAAVGSTSTFFGPLDGLNFETSLPISGSYAFGAVLGSALGELGVTSSSPAAVTGVFASKEGLAAQFQGEKFSFIPLPQDDQLRLRGVICSADRMEKDGRCRCDDLQMKLEETLAEKQAQTSSSSEENPEGKGECPLCVFIKGGPCVAEFKVWDGCLRTQKEKAAAEAAAASESEASSDTEDRRYSDCIDHMRVMMTCMMKHEYYDVFTSRGEDEIEESKHAAPAQEQQAGVETQQQEQPADK